MVIVIIVLVLYYFRFICEHFELWLLKTDIKETKKPHPITFHLLGKVNTVKPWNYQSWVLPLTYIGILW